MEALALLIVVALFLPGSWKWMALGFATPLALIVLVISPLDSWLSWVLGGVVLTVILGGIDVLMGGERIPRDQLNFFGVRKTPPKRRSP